MYYRLLQYWSLLFLGTMNKCTELRKYAFPNPCLLDFFLVFVGTTTSQNIRHFLTPCIWVLGRVKIGGHWRPHEMTYDENDGQWYPGIDGAYVFLTYSYSWGKNPEKPQSGKLIRPGIGPGPAGWEATMLPLDHNGGPGVVRISFSILVLDACPFPYPVLSLTLGLVFCLPKIQGGLPFLYIYCSGPQSVAPPSVIWPTGFHSK